MMTQITRSDALQQLLVWKTEHANGKALLKSIAPDDAEVTTRGRRSP